MKQNLSAITQQVSTILMTLINNGVKQVVLSPGSRSTPVAILLGKMQDKKLISLYVDVDERSAAFLGLGLAKTTHQPVLLVCTSGTAAANYYPAICEAHASNIPLIILTTDRPPELQDIGAPQTLNQSNFYAHQVKQAWDLPVVETVTQVSVSQYSAYITFKALQKALTSPCGPVQLNLPLRKPLMPDLQIDFSKLSFPKFLINPTVPAVTSNVLQTLTTYFSNKRGLIIAGPQVGVASYTDTLLKFSQDMNWPIIADSLSNLRNQAQTITSGKWLFEYYQMLPKELYPEVILRTGATLVSAEISDWLANTDIPIIYLDVDRAFLDSTLNTQITISASPNIVLPQLQLQSASKRWLQSWQQLDNHIQHTLQQQLNCSTLTEPQIAATLGQNLPAQSQLFISNSMPVREIEAYTAHTASGVQLFANRGANGIDGINSTALGMACANHQSSYLYIGDLAFFHDLTGLMIGLNYKIDLTIFIQNNNGGGIFSFLPQAKAKDQFEKVFGTPQNLHISALAQFYQAQYIKCDNTIDLKQIIKKKPKGLTFVELSTNRQELIQVDRKLSKVIRFSLRDYYNANHN